MDPSRRRLMRRALFGGGVSAALIVLASLLQGQNQSKSGEWPDHGGDNGFRRYSSLDQINKQTVKALRIAWTRPAVAPELKAQYPDLKYANKLMSTPLMINGALYASDGVGLVEAFDPGTGKTKWVQEPPEKEDPPRGDA